MATDAQIFDIKTIQVMIYTNDPQNRKIEMKGSVFGFGDTHAFITDSIIYSSRALNDLTANDQNKKREVFFNIDLLNADSLIKFLKCLPIIYHYIINLIL